MLEDGIPTAPQQLLNTLSLQLPTMARSLGTRLGGVYVVGYYTIGYVA